MSATYYNINKNLIKTMQVLKQSLPENYIYLFDRKSRFTCYVYTGRSLQKISYNVLTRKYKIILCTGNNEVVYTCNNKQGVKTLDAENFSKESYNNMRKFCKIYDENLYKITKYGFDKPFAFHWFLELYANRLISDYKVLF